jgi:hypothetical protein
LNHEMRYKEGQEIQAVETAEHRPQPFRVERGDSMMIEIDPTRLDLAREYSARPLGAHGPDLPAVLDGMRGQPVAGTDALRRVVDDTPFLMPAGEGARR